MTVVGLDLGTSGARIAAWVEGGVEVVPPPSGGEELAAVVSYTESGPIVGPAAVARLVSDPAATIRGAKRLLGLPRGNVAVETMFAASAWRLAETKSGELLVDFGVATKSVDEILADLVRALLDAAEARAGRRPTAAIVGVPPAWRAQRTKALRAVLAKAGIDSVRLVPETVAAVASLAPARRDQREAFVVDVGASHVAAALVRLAPDQPPQHLAVLSEDVGAEDVEVALCRAVAGLLDLKRATPADLEAIRQCCQHLPRELSMAPEASIAIPPLPSGVPGGLVRLAESHLDRALAPVIAAIGRCCEHCVRAADRTVEEAYLAGGLCRLDAVRRAAEAALGARLRVGRDPTGAVAHGAAVLAPLLGLRDPALTQAGTAPSQASSQVRDRPGAHRAAPGRGDREAGEPRDAPSDGPRAATRGQARSAPAASAGPRRCQTAERSVRRRPVERAEASPAASEPGPAEGSRRPADEPARDQGNAAGPTPATNEEPSSGQPGRPAPASAAQAEPPKEEPAGPPQSAAPPRPEAPPQPGQSDGEGLAHVRPEPTTTETAAVAQRALDALDAARAAAARARSRKEPQRDARPRPLWAAPSRPRDEAASSARQAGPAPGPAEHGQSAKGEAAAEGARARGSAGAAPAPAEQSTAAPSSASAPPRVDEPAQDAPEPSEQVSSQPQPEPAAAAPTQPAWYPGMPVWPVPYPPAPYGPAPPAGVPPFAGYPQQAVPPFWPYPYYPPPYGYAPVDPATGQSWPPPSSAPHAAAAMYGHPAYGFPPAPQMVPGAPAPWPTGQAAPAAAAAEPPPVEVGRGSLAGFATAAELLALPLGHAPSAPGPDPVALPVLLLQISGQPHLTGTLELSFAGAGTIALSIVQGMPFLAKPDRDALLEAFGRPGGTYSFEAGEPRATRGKAERALEVVLDGLRMVIRRLPVEDLTEALGRRYDLAPVLGPEQRMLAARLGLAAAEGRIVELNFDGSRTARELVGQAGAYRRTTLGVVVVLTLFDLVRYQDPTPRDGPTLAQRLAERAARMAASDHFSALSLHWSATSKDVEAARARLADELAPGGEWDKAAPEACATMRDRARAAYEVLRDDEGRARYRLEQNPTLNWETVRDVLRMKAEAMSAREGDGRLDEVVDQLLDLRTQKPKDPDGS